MEFPPRLPVDLEREIFETAALIHPATAPILLRVARRVQIWIEPLLYRVVVSYEQSPILRAIKSKPPAFFQTAVRHLCICSMSWSIEEALDVVRVCRGIVDLALTDQYACSEVLDALADTHVRRMAIPLKPLQVDLTHQAFASVTHLDILDSVEVADSNLVANIVGFPSLTHLCLNDDIPWWIVHSVLSQCSELQLLVVAWSSSSDLDLYQWAKENPVQDERLVIVRYWDFWSDWEEAANGQSLDHWSRSQDFVARKRSGDVQKDRYWLDDDSYSSYIRWLQ
ncbi:hypothetical protein FB45DRAFT_1021613 [Roridomyces roridus]|uniref:Uncharacterized protein n=1 Tax=Roridomyces roridus TaxID=1738132 RepID=A0AAD7CCG2_9AGAR|nr:hypothetical protein FB45DRAFT_1021613 [Roridomyces roridus]